MDIKERRLMQELVKTLRLAPHEKRADFLRAHSCHSGHCSTCRTIWPCTLWSAATAANHREALG